VPERYFGPTSNQAAVYDANGDGTEDLVFTIPDYYVVVSGPDGGTLIGPDWPPKIFSQPSLGLYTLPAVLESTKGDPTVCLVNGHYFQAAMTLHAQPKWYRLPETGEAPAGAEGFLRLPDGTWLMGYGRQDGRFVCVDTETGKTRWELPLAASASEVASADIDGDDRPEFLFGTSHGELYAVGDDGRKPRVLWKAHFPASVGAPVIADVDGDGACEILVGMGDGNLCVLHAPGDKAKR
jgi:outer membrane protein assembly factor BamB